MTSRTKRDPTLAADNPLLDWVQSPIARVYGALVLVPRFSIHRFGSFIGIDFVLGETLHRVVLGRRFLENITMVYDGMRAQVTFASSPDQDGSSSRPEARPVLLRDNHETQGFGASVIVARRTCLGPLIYSIPMKAVRVSVAHRRRDV